MKNFSKAAMAAEIIILLCFGLNTQAQYFPMEFSVSKYDSVDSYPNRRQLAKDSLNLCRALAASVDPSAETITFQVKNTLFKNVNFIKKSTHGKTAWDATFKLVGLTPAFLAILKNDYGLSVSLRQTEQSIESIASISIDTSCTQLNRVKFGYFNSANRLVRKVKLDSDLKEI